MQRIDCVSLVQISLIALIGCIGLSGCNSDPYAKFVGEWERKNVSFAQVLKIWKDGDSYLLKNNILEDEGVSGGGKAPTVLSNTGSQLAMPLGPIFF